MIVKFHYIFFAVEFLTYQNCAMAKENKKLGNTDLNCMNQNNKNNGVMTMMPHNKQIPSLCSVETASIHHTEAVAPAKSA